MMRVPLNSFTLWVAFAVLAYCFLVVTEVV